MSEVPHWPNPFARLSKATRATHCLRAEFAPPPRRATQDLTLEKLLQAAQDWTLNPNDRCGLLTLCAALLICPQEVRHAFTDDISWFAARNPDVPALRSTSDDEAPPTIEPFYAQFSFESLHGSLRIDEEQQVVEWLAVSHKPDLAVHYSDHENDLFAVRLLRAFLPSHQHNLSKLKLVAMALDSVSRRLDPAYPYWEDVPHWLSDSHFYS